MIKIFVKEFIYICNYYPSIPAVLISGRGGNVASLS